MMLFLPLLARIAFWTCLLIGVTYSLVLAPPGGYVGGDMLLHGLGYAGITVLGMIGWPYRPIIMLLSIIALGIALESLQALLPVRAFKLSDIASNVAGVATAFVLVSASRIVWSSPP